MDELPTHIKIKLYGMAYRALYDEMKLLRSIETESFIRSPSAAGYYNSGTPGIRCLFSVLSAYAWKRPDALAFRPGKPATVKLRFDIALILYSYLPILRKPPSHPIQEVINELDKRLNDLVPYRDQAFSEKQAELPTAQNLQFSLTTAER